MADGPCCRSTDGPSPSTFMGLAKKFKSVYAKTRLSHFRRKVRDKLGLRLGKKIKRKLGMSRVNSAAAVSSDSIYGSTGSIVGRY